MLYRDDTEISGLFKKTQMKILNIELSVQSNLVNTMRQF